MSNTDTQIPRESMPYDVTVGGAGPSGLAAAIHFRPLCSAHNTDYSIGVSEKGAGIVTRIISGAQWDPATLMDVVPKCTP